MIESVFERMDGPADPERCQGVLKNNQCHFKAVAGQRYCPRHGGGRNTELAKQKLISQYNLKLYQARVNELAGHENAKTLREEIGVTRMLLEKVINMCKSDTDLLIFSSKILTMVGQIERLVTSCHRLEAGAGMLLDKQAALNLASQMIEIINELVPDPDVIDQIAVKFSEVILNLNGSDLV